MTHPLLSILVLNFNGGKNLLASVNSIYRSRISIPFEVIVVDNGSKDGSELKAKKKFPRIKVIKLKKNYGTAALTKAQKTARGNYIFFTSDDKVLDEYCIAKLYQIFSGNPKVGQATPILLDFKTHKVDVGGTWIAPWLYAGKTMKKPKQRLTKLPYFGMGLISRQALEAAGGYLYDERFFFYGEDVDLGLRLGKAGYDIVLVRDAIAYHKGNVSQTLWKREFLYRISERNMLRTFFKNFHSIDFALRFILVVVARFVKITFDILRGRFSIARARASGISEAFLEWLKVKY